MNALILIVEDVQKTLRLLSEHLSKEGYEISPAQSGEDALKQVKFVSPDLILLDIGLPGMDGFDVCKALKANPDTRAIPIIFLTGSDKPENVNKGFELGGVDYIIKPFEAKELLARVNTHLTIRRQQRDLESYLRHELAFYISPIKGLAEFLLTKRDLDEADRSAIVAIKQSGDKMSALIKEMQRLQDFETGRFEIEGQRLQLIDIIESVITNLEATFKDLATIQCRNSADHTTVWGESLLLERVFQNLIQNAVEHVKDLEDDLERVVKVDLYHENEQVVVKINNRGEPIPRDRLTGFFDKFNTDKPGGSGLGTTVAYLVTRAHGGEISVDSNRREGTTVTVRLDQWEGD
jgi:DNA-binding response OmpR family regulator